MHRLYLPPAALAADGSELALDDAQARHLTFVLRLQPGASLEVFDGLGGRWAATLLSVAPSPTLRLGEKLPQAGPSGADVTLVQALAKGDKLDLVVQKATELGVRRIVPLASERAVVRLDAERSGKRAERLRRIAQEASRQCGRADVPHVDEPLEWDALFALIAAEPQRRALLLDPQAPLRLSQAARGEAKLLLAVGPEGGFSPAERDRALANGFVAVGLGPLVLRTETVALAALAVLQHLSGALG